MSDTKKSGMLVKGLAGGYVEVELENYEVLLCDAEEARDLLRRLQEVLGEEKCCKGCPDCQAIGRNGSVI